MTLTTRRALCAILLTLLLATGAVAASPARPWTFWYWMYGAVSKEGIKADLEGMRRVGLGGCYLMPIYGPDRHPEYGGTSVQLGDKFWEMVDYSMAVADSLGLEMGIHVCDGFALAGGPWIAPEESMQRIVFSDTIVECSGRQSISLPRPVADGDYYEDIACYALPLPSDARGALEADHIGVSPSVTRDDKGTFRANDPCWIDYAYDRPVTVRSVTIHSVGNNIQSQRLVLSVSDDGEAYEEVAHLSPPRQGWQESGFAHTYAIAPTRGRHFRFAWTPDGSEPGSEDLDAAKWRANLKLKHITLSGVSKLTEWEGKAGYVWRVAPETTRDELPTGACSQMGEIHRLTVSHDRVTATLPTGRWAIVRMGHASTKHSNATGGGGKGLECDKFTAATVEKQVDHWFGAFMQRPHAARVVKKFHVDSWECGSQNWSKDFATEFRRRRGYDLLRWLPVMAGYPINSAEESERVLRDVRETINDLINERFFATVQRRAHAYGCEFTSESVAPTMVSDGLDHYRYADVPMGEYWLNSPTHDKPNDMLDAISGAHIYGKPIVQGEGFTEVRGVWDETPASVKSLLDLHFALGMNRLVFHVDTHNPWPDRRPGMTLDGIGLFFQRDQTWYEESRAMVDYITLCQERLQSGHDVSDLAVFIGEEMPRRSLLPDRLVTMLPGLVGTTRYIKEQQRLANQGQPMEESPVGVNHSAGITTARDWVDPLRGYRYDCINRDALLRLAKVEDGCLVLPGGARYRALVVPTLHAMNPSLITLSDEMSRQIEAFRSAGLPIIDTPHTADDLSEYGIERDVEVPVDIAWSHRSQPGRGEIYFLSNQQPSERTVSVSFRTNPYTTMRVYDPVVRKYIMDESVANADGRRVASLVFPASGSLFVEFTNDTIARLRNAFHPTVEVEATGGWTLDFESNGLRHHADSLYDWSHSTVDSIRYYSGRVRYATTFVIDSTQVGEARLSLGKLHDVAHVWMNGVDCGIVWTPPYEADVSQAIHAGENHVEIDVVNTWANALRGADAGTPPFGGIWTNARYRLKGDTLLPAGLLGPMTLRHEVAP